MTPSPPPTHGASAFIRRAIDRIAGCRRGVSAIEFALIAPVFMTMICGFFNVGQLFYGQSILDGAVQKAARSSALETGDTATADEKVREAVSTVLPGAEVTASRVSYYDFADIGRPERWDDEDGNGTCNDGEAYTDENPSGDWDAEISVSGKGGVSDLML